MTYTKYGFWVVPGLTSIPSLLGTMEYKFYKKNWSCEVPIGMSTHPGWMNWNRVLSKTYVF